MVCGVRESQNKAWSCVSVYAEHGTGSWGYICLNFPKNHQANAPNVAPNMEEG